MKTQEQEIVEDIRRVARGLGLKTGDQLSRSEYLNNGARFSMYQIYDGGMTWSHYCQKVGFEPKAAESVPDEMKLPAPRGGVSFRIISNARNFCAGFLILTSKPLPHTPP